MRFFVFCVFSGQKCSGLQLLVKFMQSQFAYLLYIHPETNVEKQANSLLICMIDACLFLRIIRIISGPIMAEDSD